MGKFSEIHRNIAKYYLTSFGLPNDKKIKLKKKSQHIILE